MTYYDLAIIGSGSGNSLVTKDWDNKRVAIIDGGIFGGTCLNVGCIPTKMLVYPAEIGHMVAEGKVLGVDATVINTRWTDIRDRIFGRIDAISEGGRKYRAEELENVTLYEENARFTSRTTLETASGAVIEAGHIVVAAGSRAVKPPIEGIDLPQVHTSDSVMRVDELPRRVLIIGGGYIAAEFAGIFTGLGSSVTMVNRSGTLLRGQDSTVTERFTDAAAGLWDLKLNCVVQSIIENTDGSVTANLASTQDNRQESIQIDLVLVATGRVPNSDTLACEVAGIDRELDGRVRVDQYQRVLSDGEPVEGLWALGDVSSEHQLKHVANHEARVVGYNLIHPQDLRASDHRFIPAAVFTHPQIASVGLTEDQALARGSRTGVATVLAVQEYTSTAYGWAMEDTTGFVKLIAEKKSGRLLGAHIMGHEASILIQPLIQAMSQGLPVAEMARGQYWIHPALTEVVENALLSLNVDPTPGDPI
ncbi:mycothione reductase [Arthrobacter roseus]|uniref:mycothione reductase n=1 Tax=Arthrobacter roseus TaxID=136274 RepID=UPI0019647FCB|nr:mycothione reductase [Arthrobacter roseus]